MSLAKELPDRVGAIFGTAWDIRDGRVVPESNDVALDGGGVKLDATILYADLKGSSRLATQFQPSVAAKVVRAYLHCMCQIITGYGGTITSFDGDRVMALFIGDYKNSTATKVGLKMAYAMEYILAPQATKQFKSIADAGFRVEHCVGVDTSPVLAVRAGQRGSNDLVWVGRAPNLAAKLSQIRNAPYRTYITAEVFNMINDDSKYFNGATKDRLMWEKRKFEFLGSDIEIYRSKDRWTL